MSEEAVQTAACSPGEHATGTRRMECELARLVAETAARRHAPHKPATVVGVHARPQFGAAGGVSRSPGPPLPGAGGLGAGRDATEGFTEF